ncbi:MAG TPA: hypothetical protein VK387_03290, partial [Thermoleophilaceae bacterium]|nr:hypothetical protein [Thermoleophilaceae bacterium]
YGMVGWLIFDEHAPDRFGTIGDAMLNLFVMLTLENLPENLAMGRARCRSGRSSTSSRSPCSRRSCCSTCSSASSSTRWRRRALELARAERELADADPGNDEAAHDVVLAERVRSIRQSLDDLERELARSPLAPIGAPAARDRPPSDGSRGD